MKICPVCKEERQDDEYCEECYTQVTAEISELAGIGHGIEWSIRTDSDVDLLTTIIQQAETVIWYATKLRDDFEEEMKE